MNCTAPTHHIWKTYSIVYTITTEPTQLPLNYCNSDLVPLLNLTLPIPNTLLWKWDDCNWKRNLCHHRPHWNVFCLEGVVSFILMGPFSDMFFIHTETPRTTQNAVFTLPYLYVALNIENRNEVSGKHNKNGEQLRASGVLYRNFWSCNTTPTFTPGIYM